jgi:hypothetical protein
MLKDPISKDLSLKVMPHQVPAPQHSDNRRICPLVEDNAQNRTKINRKSEKPAIPVSFLPHRFHITSPQ